MKTGSLPHEHFSAALYRALSIHPACGILLVVEVELCRKVNVWIMKRSPHTYSDCFLGNIEQACVNTGQDKAPIYLGLTQ